MNFARIFLYRYNPWSHAFWRNFMKAEFVSYDFSMKKLFPP